MESGEKSFRLIFGGRVGYLEDITKRVLLERIGQCRLALVTSYHSAVFSLAQGVPVVALVASDYYKEKFSGLKDFFPEVLEIIDMGRQDAARKIFDAVVKLWVMKKTDWEKMDESVSRIITESKYAYKQLKLKMEERNK